MQHLNDSLGETFPTNERQSVYPNGTLHLRRVVTNDAGEYDCSVEDAGGLRKARGSLRIKVKGEIPFWRRALWVASFRGNSFGCILFLLLFSE